MGIANALISKTNIISVAELRVLIKDITCQNVGIAVGHDTWNPWDFQRLILLVIPIRAVPKLNSNTIRRNFSIRKTKIEKLFKFSKFI